MGTDRAEAMPALEDTEGTVFNIQRFCTHDGPGIRTTVFFKGCPLHCPWCHNPEGIAREREMAYDPSRCIGCRACLAACVHGAHEFLDDGGHVRHTARCVRCGACLEHCYAGALEAVGETKTAREVVDVVVRDKPFYDNSDGGATLSGGEPLYQPQFAAAVLQLCRQESVQTALETSCLAPWDTVERLVPLVDYWMCDVKHVNAARHRELTGADNRMVLDNARALAQRGATLLLRLPLVPGLNDDEEALRGLGAFVAEIGPSEGLEIMPYHRIGQGKYERMDQQYTLTGLEEAGDDDIRRAAALLRDGGAGTVSCQPLEDL